MFSVIMPLYNHAEYVTEAVESVRRQTFPDWELMLVDDGSTDASGAIADALAARDGRIRVLHQANAGPAAARNAGLRATSRPWLAYLDSDDAWYPRTLEAYRQAVAGKPGESFFYGHRHRLNPDGSVTESPGLFQDRPTGPRDIFQRMYLSHLCVCCRRALIEQAGYYDEKLRGCEDYELYLRLSLLASFHPIGEATGLRRRHAGNLSEASGFSRFQEAEVLRRFIRRQGGAKVVPDEMVRSRLGKVYYSSGRLYFREWRFGHAAVALDQARRFRRTARTTALRVLARLLSPLTGTGRPDLPWLDGPE